MRWRSVWLVAILIGCSSSGSNEEADPCDPPPIPGQSCGTERMCEYGSDCGSATYGCIDGTWQTVAVSGCGVNAVACTEAPEHGDECETPGEICDPDDDCLDVLECGAYVWEAFEVCTEVACAEAQPIVSGADCELPSHQFCKGAPPCESSSYRCLDGQWSPFGGVPAGCE